MWSNLERRCGLDPNPINLTDWYQTRLGIFGLISWKRLDLKLLVLFAMGSSGKWQYLGNDWMECYKNDSFLISMIIFAQDRFPMTIDGLTINGTGRHSF